MLAWMRALALGLLLFVAAPAAAQTTALDAYVHAPDPAYGWKLIRTVDEGQATTYVLELGPAMKVVARNPLRAGGDESFRASLTPSGGQMFSRSDRALYCIGRQGGAGKD